MLSAVGGNGKFDYPDKHTIASMTNSLKHVIHKTVNAAVMAELAAAAS
jgi:hypothetical protein